MIRGETPIMLSFNSVSPAFTHPSYAFLQLRLPSILITPLMLSFNSVSPAFTSPLSSFPLHLPPQPSHHSSPPPELTYHAPIIFLISYSPGYSSPLLSFPSLLSPQDYFPSDFFTINMNWSNTGCSNVE
jgi:hypothetical protein